MPLDAKLLSAGIEHHQAGRLAEAHEIYLRALAAEPANAVVHSLLGAVCINLRRYEEAAGYLTRALQLDPNNHAAHDNLGVLLAKQGRLAEAVDSFRRAARINPHHAQTHQNLAAALERAGRASEAIDSYRRATQLDPNSRRANAELARLLGQAGRAVEAVPHFRQLARLKPDDPKAHFELAASLAAAGQLGEAVSVYQQTLRLKPDSAETCVNLASLYIQKKEYEEAAGWARRAIEMRPRFAEAHYNLGAALAKQPSFDEAAVALREAIRLKPELYQAYDNLGNVLVEQGEFAAGIEQYRTALRFHPRGAESLYNWGIAQLKQVDPAGAIDLFDRALSLNPNYAEAHHNRASAMLMTGRFEEGLAEYEWRFRSSDFAPFRPRWNLWNGEPPVGRTIVLVAEQGMGDTLQFVRYAGTLAERGARVIVECPASLHPLLSRTPGIDQLIAPADPPPEADLCVPLLSVPHRLGTRLESIPAPVPYLAADEDCLELWRERLAGYREFKVGIVWQGNPKFPGDRLRSIPLEKFEPLARVAGARLFSLQYGHGSEQLEPLAEAWGVVDLGDELNTTPGAFMDAAAIIKQLDLVIAPDTAVAHLAGALGAPVWTALPWLPDWRWMLEREDTPWYPTMRLFRQTRYADWDGVIARLAEALRSEVQAGR